MKKYLVLILLLIIFIPVDFFATSGALQGGTIKECPNGKLYGKHTNHWHRAVKRGNNYYASGSEIKNDPCPPKSDDNELHTLTIDGDNIWIYYDMRYETYNKDIKIVAKASHPKAKVKVDYNGLSLGKNNIPIIVTAENGEKKEYKLVVTLLESDMFLKSLKLNDDNIEISNNMTYETYDKNLSIDAIANDTNIKVSNNYKELVDGENNITITLTDNYNNTKNYSLKVILKQRDLSLKNLKIDNNEIEISDNMTYETYNKNIVIEAIPNDLNVKVENNLNELVTGDNIILITLSSEQEDKKEYVLTVVLKERTLTLDYLSINNEIINISSDMVYETYSDDITIETKSNYDDVTITNNYEKLDVGNNYITITVSDNYGNSIDYVVNVIKLVNEVIETPIPVIEEIKEDKEEENESEDNTAEIVGGITGITVVGTTTYAIVKKGKKSK